MSRKICIECREFWVSDTLNCPQCGKRGEVIEDETLDLLREIWSDFVLPDTKQEDLKYDRFVYSEEAQRIIDEEGLTLSDAIDDCPMFITDIVWEPGRWVERIDILEDGSIERRVLDMSQGISSFFKKSANKESEWKARHKKDMDAEHLEKLGDLWLAQMEMRATNFMTEGQYGVC